MTTCQFSILLKRYYCQSLLFWNEKTTNAIVEYWYIQSWDLIERLRRRLYAMMLNYFTLLFYLACYILMSLVTTSKALSILLLEPIPSTSHHVWAENLIKGLLRKGHHVHITSIHETKIEGKLAQNLTYAVSRCYETHFDKKHYPVYMYVHANFHGTFSSHKM